MGVAAGDMLPHWGAHEETIFVLEGQSGLPQDGFGGISEIR